MFELSPCFGIIMPKSADEIAEALLKRRRGIRGLDDLLTAAAAMLRAQERELERLRGKK